jgi:multidrug efflux pump subunit AcrB
MPAVSRMRPVMLAAGTTILGLIPLLSDVFFVNMSVTIMAGLGFATLLTLFVVPTLYALLFQRAPLTGLRPRLRAPARYRVRDCPGCR